MEFHLVLFLTLCFVKFLGKVNGACTFPSDLTGTWRSSRWDDIVFTSSQVTMSDFQGAPLTFNCETQVGNKYLLRSDTPMSLLLNNVEIVTCIELSTSVLGVKYIFYHATYELALPGGDKQPIRLVSPGTPISTSDTCTITSYPVGSNDVMINTASIPDAVVTCATPLLSNFDNYTVISTSGTTFCDGVGYIHVCNDSQTVNVDYNVCSEMIFYSDGGVLSCVHSSSSGSVYYVNLLNNDTSVDNTATFHYTCVVIEISGTTVYASQWPGNCDTSQTPTSVSSSVGYTFVMASNRAPDEEEGGGSSSSVIPAIVAILMIVIIGVGIYYFCYRKKIYEKLHLPCVKEKSTPKGKIDPSTQGNGVPPHSIDTKDAGMHANFFPYDYERELQRKLTNATAAKSSATVLSNTLVIESVEDQTPRRLPPISPKVTKLTIQETDVSDSPKKVQRLPPISEGYSGTNECNKSEASASAVIPNVIGQADENSYEKNVPPQATYTGIS